ncbi:hypothetical protein TKK_0009001 [Trichogramma kaykai]
MGIIGSKEQAKTPPLLCSLTRQEWLQWKKCFLKLLNYKYIPPYKQANKFFKYTGFLGEEIANRLYFHGSMYESTLRTLLFKFDVYFIYCGITKPTEQSISEYVFILKHLAEEAELFDPTTKKTGDETHSGMKINDIIKEKILQDFKTHKIFDDLNNRRSTLYISNYENLALNELVHLWKEYEKTYRQNHEENQIVEKNIHQNSCDRCGLFHDNFKCHAIGKNCWNCGERNHFAKVCQKYEVIQCPCCGSDHAQNNCPATAQECSKCKGLHHFAWKCPWEMCSPCMYCGENHINNPQICSAHNNQCSNCYVKGHFTTLCPNLKNKK